MLNFPLYTQLDAMDCGLHAPTYWGQNIILIFFVKKGVFYLLTSKILFNFEAE
jgi:hypothetical protein